MTHGKTMRALTGALLAIAFAAVCALALPSAAHGLETAPYTPGEDYYIDDEEAFREQDIEHEGAVESEASTSYFLTSAFYLNWISPDSTIYEGETAYIGCGATGLETLDYEWLLSKDGGETFEPAGLNGPEHTVVGLQANDPEEQPYLFRCIITNGDRTSQLEADVWVTVIDVPDPAGGTLGRLGDQTMTLACACMGLAFAACAVAIPLLMRRFGREGEEREPSPKARG